MTFDITQLDWSKGNGLLPAIVQHARDGRVLMLGYVNRVSMDKTLREGVVWFWSRSKQRLWKKGEASGHVLTLVAAHADCDADTVLLRVLPAGPTCHTGTDSCFGAAAAHPAAFLSELDALIHQRKQQPQEGSYTNRLLDAGIRRIAQKVGEEGVETALAAVTQTDDDLLNEAADLLYHLDVLLAARGLDLDAVAMRLHQRHAKPPELHVN